MPQESTVIAGVEVLEVEVPQPRDICTHTPNLPQ
jgi:hypothetical protein